MKISLKSHGYLKQISCKSEANLRRILGKSQANLRQISGKSQAFPRHISNIIYQTNVRQILCKSQAGKSKAQDVSQWIIKSIFSEFLFKRTLWSEICSIFLLISRHFDTCFPEIPTGFIWMFTVKCVGGLLLLF